MEYYHRHFPKKLALMIDVSSGEAAPEGRYTFFELYCCNLGCDCNNVVFHVIRKPRGIFGVFRKGEDGMLQYTWAEKVSKKNPVALKECPQPEWMDAVRELLIGELEKSSDYKQQLQAHYTEMKKLPGNEGTYFIPERLGRNESCFCGSGKKYKKCCLNKK